MSPRVVLVGAPGAGKTTVGRLVAERLEVPFADSDHLVEAAAGTSVADIFVVEGEPRFRELEREVVSSALPGFDGVLALGGGAVLDARTRADLAEQQVVLLRVGLAAASRRVGLNRDRPLLMGNVRATLGTLLQERAAVYEQVARASVDTDDLTADEVAAAVLALVADGVQDRR